MNLRPSKSKFKVAKVDMSGLKSFGSKIDENILLMNSAETMKDYDDLTYLSRKAVNMYGQSLSKMKTPFDDYLKGNKAVHYTDNNFVRWRQYGEPDNRCMFLEDVTGTETPGLGKLPFEVKLDWDGFLPGALISPLLDKTVKFRVLEHGIKSGGGTIYLVELVTDNEYAFAPKELFAEGTYAMQMGSAYGEGSKDLAGLKFMTDFAYVEFEVPLITGRWKFEVTNEAHLRWGNLVLGEASTSEKGITTWDKSNTKISGWLEAKAFTQISWEKELWDTYGNSSETLIDRSSAKVLTTSPGMFEYLAEGNVFRYSVENGSIDQFSNRLEVVWHDRVEPSRQSIVFFTGKGGIKTFHEWVLEKFGQEAVLGTYDFVLKEASSFHNSDTDGYAYASYQFTRYNIQPWGVISVAYWPMLDNMKINLVKAPNGLYPASSYEFFAFNAQLGDEPNIRKLIRNNSEHSGFVNGHWTALGAAGPNNPMKPSHTGLFYEWGYGDSHGLQIDSIQDLVWFRPNWVY